MKLHALAAIVGAGCTAAPGPYEVDAVAELEPLGTPDARITGPIEILGTGSPDTNADFGRTVAAYHVQLPDGAAPWVRLYTATSCTPGDPPMLFEDLGAIRRVGDETHFFARDVQIGDRTVDVDTGTATAGIRLHSFVYGNVFSMIAVVQAPGGDLTIQGPDGNPVPAGGPWLACGMFVTP